MKAIDLFSGCGGLTLGLKWAGFQVLWAVDNDPLSVETYEAYHKDVLVCPKDIRAQDPSEVLRNLHLQEGELDLLAGCPPCQGFSSIRTLNGSRPVDDPRNDLIFDFIRFVKVFKPKTVMLENVPRLAVDSRMSYFKQELSDMGYRGEPQILNAADYGVPQRRRRVIFLAAMGKSVELPSIDPLRRTVRDAISFLPPPGESGDPLHDQGENRSLRILDLIKKIPKNGGSRKDLGDSEQLACHRKCNGFKDVYGRMSWDDVAPTITGGCVNPSKGRFLHPEQDRAITLREASLLQSFPPDYPYSLKRGKFAAAVMIGNALPPEFIKRLASHLSNNIS